MFELWFALQIGIGMDINVAKKKQAVDLNFDTVEIFINCKLAGPDSRMRWFQRG